MKNNIKWIVILVLFVALLSFLVGRSFSSDKKEITIQQHTKIIKEISQLATLEVHGVSNITISNENKSGTVWSKIVNFMSENTLLIQVPYTAKYGCNVMANKIEVEEAKKQIRIAFDSTQLLSLQLHLDSLSSMNKTGLFNFTSLTDFKSAQTQLYSNVKNELELNKVNRDSATKHFKNIMNNFYENLGYKVVY